MPPTELTHPAIDAVLATAASLLGMEIAFVGGLTEDTFTFERVHALQGGGWPEVQEGASFARSDSLCAQMLETGQARTTDAAADPVFRTAGATEGLGIRSYVGVPVRDDQGRVVATLCGMDRDSVAVNDQAVQVLGQLAEIVAAHLGPLVEQGVVIRRSPTGAWQVGDTATGDLNSAMVLADLLAGELAPGSRPRRGEAALDEVGQLRLLVAQLEHALAARVIVEQAIGVLTERQRHTPREAFERLRRSARSRGRRVHDLAREVVLSAGDPSVPLPPELAGRR